MVNKNHPNIDHRRPYDHGKSSSLLLLSNLADPHHHYCVNHHHHHTSSFQHGHCLPQSLLVSVILLCFVVGISMTLWLWAVALKVLGQSLETSSVEWSKRTEGLLPDGTMNSATCNMLRGARAIPDIPAARAHRNFLRNLAAIVVGSALSEWQTSAINLRATPSFYHASGHQVRSMQQ